MAGPPVQKPMDDYLLDKWLEMPYAARNDDKLPYDKYHYKDGESIGSIARIISKPWKKFTTHEIVEFNWGMICRAAEINYYLKRHNGCTQTDHDDKVFKFAAADQNPFLWVPRPIRTFNGRYTSPGGADVGHVALDDVTTPKHIDTLVIRPSYSISLELGDIDALFDSIAPGVDPATSPGVWQRLQVLGYHYIPLGNHAYPLAKRQSAMRLVWENYRKLHTPKGNAAHIRPPTNPELVAILKQEVQNNIVSVVKSNLCTASGEILDGRLPDPPVAAALVEDGAEGPERPAVDVEYARIRLPGGYSVTSAWHRGNHFDASFVHTIGAERHEVEADIADHCTLADNTTKLLGRIPLIAQVYRVYPDGKEEPAEGATVYFQLVAPPHPLPDGCPAKAPELRNTEMNYGVADRTIWPLTNWGAGYVKQSGAAISQADVLGMARTIRDTAQADRADALRRLVLARNPGSTWDAGYAKTAPASVSQNDIMTMMGTVRDTPNAERGGRLNRLIFDRGSDFAEAQAIRADVNHHVALADAETTHIEADVNHHVALADANRLEIQNTGPKRFVDDIYADQALRYVVPDEDPQKNNVDCQYGGTRRVPVQGGNVGGTVFPGVFEISGTDRPGFHTRRDDKHADYGTLRRAVAITDATAATEHPHAVKATVNDKGYAGVIFTPSRCGGDAYQIRAYVGPPTLQFDGKAPDGPVAETGTMVVWRNIRLHRYVQMNPPARAAVSADVEAIYSEVYPAFAPDTYNETGWTFDQYWTFHDFAWPNPASPHGPYVNLVEPGAPGGGAIETQYPAIGHRVLPWTFISLVEQYKRCYCELIIDQRVKDGPQKGHVDRDAQAVTAAEHQAAYNLAKAAAQAHNVNGKNIDWNALLVDAVGTSPFLFSVRHPDHYNDVRGGGSDDIDAGDIVEICSALGYKAIGAFIEHFAGEGVLGLSLVQGVGGCTWDDLVAGGGVLNGALVLTSGVADSGRAAALFYSDTEYRRVDFYSVTANAGHELGHVLTRSHQPANPGGLAAHHQPQALGGPDPPTAPPAATPRVAAAVPAAGPVAGDRDVGDCTCLMGYQGCYGEYCGRCVLALRGWKTGAGTIEAATG